MAQDHRCLACMYEKGTEQVCPHCGCEEGTALESLLHLAPGTVLSGKYLVGKALGQGGFGITYLAWDNYLNIKLAIKEYLPQQLATRRSNQSNVSVIKNSLSEEFKYGLTKFLEEARTLARFNEYPNVVSVLDYFEENNTAYLVMNYLEGMTLQKYLQSRGNKISFKQALDIFMPVLDALKEVHSTGVLHRDISPDNLLVNTRGQVVLIDFGAARQAMGEKSRSLSVIMKAGYSPLEQYQSRGRQGPWTDIYAAAATIYRCITGRIPIEPLDRVTGEVLTPPSKYGLKIEARKEAALVKALSIRIEDRYQTVQAFQEALISGESETSEAGLEEEKTEVGHEAEDDSLEAGNFAAGEIEDHMLNEPLEEEPLPAGIKNFSRLPKFAIFILTAGLLIFGGLNLFGKAPEEGIYEFDHRSGTISLNEVEIGARVVDNSWKWVFKTGENYTGTGEKKPVTWIVVARNHYEGLDPHVTLLSEELIGKQVFDNSTDRGSSRGSNDWGNSGTTDAEAGLRPWLNSDGSYGKASFYNAFSDHFKEIVLVTEVPNREWQNGDAYITSDKVFIPSTTELGDIEHERTYKIGATYSFFEDTENVHRVARLGEEEWWYVLRSPVASQVSLLRSVSPGGSFSHGSASQSSDAVRPVINVRSDAMVSIMPD